MVLEILVGTDLILASNTHESVIKLFQDSLEFIDNSLGTLLEGLLSDDCFFDLDKAVQSFQACPEDMIAISVRMMDAALKEDRNL